MLTLCMCEYLTVLVCIGMLCEMLVCIYVGLDVCLCAGRTDVNACSRISSVKPALMREDKADGDTAHYCFLMTKSRI